MTLWSGYLVQTSTAVAPCRDRKIFCCSSCRKLVAFIFNFLIFLLDVSGLLNKEADTEKNYLIK
jgi:hypothetical protein